MPSSATKFADVKAAPLSRRSADIRHGLTYAGKSLPLRQRSNLRSRSSLEPGA